MWPSLLYGCLGQRQEVAAETLERSLYSLIFRPSIRPCHTPAENCPGASHPTENKTQLFTMHMRPKPPSPCHSHQPHLPHWPLQPPCPLAGPQTSQAWSCLRVFAHAAPLTWNTLLSTLPTAGSFSSTELNSDATSPERPSLTTLFK